MKYVIIGSGVAGLTAAYRLLEKGHEVIVLEKEPVIGGLSRSFRYGDFTFDIGPHRFFTHNPEVSQFIRMVLKHDYSVINRINSIYLLDRYFPWPLTPRVLVRLPPHLLFRIAFDMCFKIKLKNEDLKSSAISKYGKTLFELVFKDYTEKFCHVPCEGLHCGWLKASLEKMVIDKRIKTGSLFDLCNIVYKSMGSGMGFLYPKGGCGRFSEKLGKMISDKGGRVIKGIQDISLDIKNNRIVSLHYDGSDKGITEVDHLIYTAPITQLNKQLGLGIIDLEYLNSVIYNIEINRPLGKPEQWIYFGDSKLSFVRISFPGNFDRDNVPPGKDSLCVEITCKGDDQLWESPGSIKERLVDDLVKVNLCLPDDIDTIHIEKIANTYPIYKLNYLEELGNIQRKLSKFHNLTCLGRTGSFWYNNMDESIEMALRVTN